jgi:hypothetical protein
VLDIAEQRHEIHAGFFGIDQETGDFKFTKFEHESEGHAIRNLTRSYQQMEKRAKKMLDLAEEFARFSNRLARHFAR